MSYKIEWEEDNIITTFKGVLTFKDIMEVDNIMYGDKRFNEMKFQLWDFSDVKKVELSRQEMKIIATLDVCSSIWNKNMKIALVTINQRLLNLIWIYKKSIKDINWSVEIFSSIEGARKWVYIK